MKTTWKAPSGGHGTLDADDRNKLPDSAYAFPDKRKEPLTDARHVQTALARFGRPYEALGDEDKGAVAGVVAARMKKNGYDPVTRVLSVQVDSSAA